MQTLRLIYEIPDAAVPRRILGDAVRFVHSRWPVTTAKVMDGGADRCSATLPRGYARIGVFVPQDHRAYLAMLWALMRINVWCLRTMPLDPLYKSGVTYQREPKGCEVWMSTPVLYERGEGDCEDIACALAAEYRKIGVPALPVLELTKLPGGKRLFHVVVQLPDGSREDPSRRLGMPV